MALCTPATSILAGMKEMVASPAAPPGTMGGTKKRMIESGSLAEKGRRLCTMSGLKCFMLLIFLYAAGSAKMDVIGDVGSS